MLDRATGRAQVRLPSRAESALRPESRGGALRPVIAAPEPLRLRQWARPHLFAARPPPTSPFLPVSSVSCELPRKPAASWVTLLIIGTIQSGEPLLFLRPLSLATAVLASTLPFFAQSNAVPTGLFGYRD